MSAAIDFATPRQALDAMIAAGAVFTVRHRDNCLGLSFSYSVTAGGDAQSCRKVLAAVKSRPAAFFDAFRAAVQEAARVEGQSANPRAVDVVSTTSTRSTPKADVATSPSLSATAPVRGAA